MKDTISKKIDSTKKFVQKHKTPIAAAAGLVVGFTAFAVVVKDNRYMVLTPEIRQHLEKGGVVMYSSEWFGLLTTKPDGFEIPTT